MTATPSRTPRRVFRALLRTFALGIVPLVVVPVVLGRALLQHRIASERRITSPNGVESLERVTLGGLPQWILIRGWERSNPVLLYLHGGPGFPETAVARLFCNELERHFVVVHWDQRGAGKSNRFGIDRDSFTVADYLEDTRQLIELLRLRFGVERIHLVGHSWGSYLGALTARDHPELLHAFVGLGQVVDWKRQEEIGYQFVVEQARTRGNRKAMAELEAIRPPYENQDELWLERKWLSRFGGDFIDGRGMRPYVLSGALSPHYSVLDGLRYWLGARSPDPMWRRELRQQSLMPSALRLEVPVYFLAGRRDYNTPSEVVEEYYKRLEAPRKELIWFEHSAHSPNLEEPDRFQEVLISRLLAESNGAERPRLRDVNAPSE
jgi:pimeloyl-ACP methyl ester carboxylesterase